MDKTIIDQFWEARSKITDRRIATHYKHDDTLIYEANLIKKHLKPDDVVLDLGLSFTSLF